MRFYFAFLFPQKKHIKESPRQKSDYANGVFSPPCHVKAMSYYAFMNSEFTNLPLKQEMVGSKPIEPLNVFPKSYTNCQLYVFKPFLIFIIYFFSLLHLTMFFWILANFQDLVQCTYPRILIFTLHAASIKANCMYFKIICTFIPICRFIH